MSQLDGTYSPFDKYPGSSSMAPCMRTCNYDQNYNGCDNARCFCTKPNLDLRIQRITRCASSFCTFQNMNTQTDVDIMSGIQVLYCADRGFSPAGMAMPATTAATTTTGGGSFSSGRPTTTGSGSVPGSVSRTGLSPGASSTSREPPNTNPNTNSGSSALSVAAKAGMGIGAAFCVLLAIAIILLLRRRRQPQPQYYPPPPQIGNPPMVNNFPNSPPPQMGPTPYSTHGPFSPPPLQQPTPIQIPQQTQGYTKGDVSPIEEKANPVFTVSRKSLGSTPANKEIDITTPHDATPAPAAAANGPKEVAGDVPPQRHEVTNEGEITNTVTTRGMELDSSQQPVRNQYPTSGAELPGEHQYHQSPQGQWGNYQGAHEIDGGQNQWHQRQELGGGQHGWGTRHEVDGGQNQWIPGQGQQRQDLGGAGPGYPPHELSGR